MNVVGVMYQLASTITESVRLVLVQLLLQSRGLKLNPVTTLYYVAPCCFCFLLLPFFYLEAHKFFTATDLIVDPLLLLLNAVVAFGERALGGRALTRSGDRAQ